MFIVKNAVVRATFKFTIKIETIITMEKIISLCFARTAMLMSISVWGNLNSPNLSVPLGNIVNAHLVFVLYAGRNSHPSKKG